jgi:hypothetical protein
VPRWAVGSVGCAPAVAGCVVGVATVHVAGDFVTGSADRESLEPRTGVLAGGTEIGAATGSLVWTCRAGVSTSVFGCVTAGFGCGGAADARAAGSCGDGICLRSQVWLGTSVAPIAMDGVMVWAERSMPTFGLDSGDTFVSARAPSVVSRRDRPASLGTGAAACGEAEFWDRFTHMDCRLFPSGRLP